MRFVLLALLVTALAFTMLVYAATRYRTHALADACAAQHGAVTDIDGVPCCVRPRNTDF